ncbi:hypothetical protein PUMCH_001587 [Australozyma saopauloensis]|uniref:Thiamine phosphate synthase/TenI domain-containing protein n=1 Tax=Australozyma saopauloensis TaxID=291208 RepID=A0AAX4H773_9ASCO|nr:hypothetical protein PUMCH_001587 [[Candida] saopauloensis]
MAPVMDLTFYLVTDSTMVPDTSTFLDQVKLAAENGATIIQLREKKLLTRDFVQRAQKVLEITRPRGIPLIINDRVDVALAVDADGVHVGQDDMPAAVVRELIGPNKILGVSCCSPEETRAVCEEGVADYVGLGTCYPTNTKDVKSVVGPIGIRKSLQVLRDHSQNNKRIESVAIGGINHTNVAKVLLQCSLGNFNEKYGVDGVAVVSCIMAAKDAAVASVNLLKAIQTSSPLEVKTLDSEYNYSEFPQKPMVHHITNNVVKNFSANVTLSIGASPIMSEFAPEFGELSGLRLPVSLLINLGTPSPATMEVFLAGLSAYNGAGKPTLFDPVAAGATLQRLEASKALLNAGQFTVIKGNVGEIMALDKLTSEYIASESAEPTMQGVDSLATLLASDVLALAKRVSAEFKSIVVITGKENFVVNAFGSSEVNTYRIAGGHELMGSVTGTGCSLGSVICAYLAIAQNTGKDMTLAVAAAVKYYNEAGAKAGLLSKGPGTFTKNFMDALSGEL